MNTETLRTFIAAAQIKNFTKTADHLFIAQSTVTNRILDLESEIGKPLFTRKHKQIELTEAGLQFLDYAKQLVDLETTALQTVRSSLSPDERLRIGTTNTIYECRLQYALRKWMKAKPLSTIILNIGHTAEMIESLKKGNLDMVFSFVSFYGDGYWCRPYYSEDLCLVCTAEDTTWADGISKENLPEIEDVSVMFEIFKSFVAVATFSSICSLGNARFSKPKAISLSVSTLKNCVLGF